MKQRILDYFRYELPENLFDKILIAFLGLLVLASLTMAILVGRDIRRQEQAIVRLQHTIDSISSSIEREVPARRQPAFFPPEYRKDFPAMD